MIAWPHDGTTKAITYTPTLDSLTDFQANEENYIYHAWTSSQHDLFLVAVISLVFLCGVCIAVWALFVLFMFTAYKKRNGGNRILQKDAFD